MTKVYVQNLRDGMIHIVPQLAKGTQTTDPVYSTLILYNFQKAAWELDADKDVITKALKAQGGVLEGEQVRNPAFLFSFANFTDTEFEKGLAQVRDAQSAAQSEVADVLQAEVEKLGAGISSTAKSEVPVSAALKEDSKKGKDKDRDRGSKDTE